MADLLGIPAIHSLSHHIIARFFFRSWAAALPNLSVKMFMLPRCIWFPWKPYATHNKCSIYVIFFFIQSRWQAELGEALSLFLQAENNKWDVSSRFCSVLLISAPATADMAAGLTTYKLLTLLLQLIKSFFFFYNEETSFVWGAGGGRDSEKTEQRQQDDSDWSNWPNNHLLCFYSTSRYRISELGTGCFLLVEAMHNFR